jgi:hypothetical protein
MRREKTQVSRIKNAKGEITTNTIEVQEITREFIFQINSKILKKWTDF